MRGIVGYFNKSTAGIQDLATIQRELNLPVKKPVQDVITRWRSSHDMNQFFRQMQAALMTYDIRHAANAGAPRPSSHSQPSRPNAPLPFARER